METDSVKAKSVSDKKMTLTEILDEWCIFYMNIGVSFDEFWNGDYTKFPYYYRAYMKRQEAELEKRNYEMYIQGLYNYRAFSSVAAAVMWAIIDKRGQRPDGYLDHPIPLTENEKKAAEEREKQATLKWVKEGQK